MQKVYPSTRSTWKYLNVLHHWQRNWQLRWYLRESIRSWRQLCALLLSSLPSMRLNKYSPQNQCNSPVDTSKEPKQGCMLYVLFICIWDTEVFGTEGLRVILSPQNWTGWQKSTIQSTGMSSFECACIRKHSFGLCGLFTLEKPHTWNNGVLIQHIKKYMKSPFCLKLCSTFIINGKIGSQDQESVRSNSKAMLSQV